MKCRKKKIKEKKRFLALILRDYDTVKKKRLPPSLFTVIH